jgi:hypothetical protein
MKKEEIMEERGIAEYIMNMFAGVETADNFGYTFFF